MNSDFDLPAALKAIHWEQVKGHLRTLVAIDGQRSSGETERPYRYQKVSEAVEKFISEFEYEGWNE